MSKTNKPEPQGLRRRVYQAWFFLSISLLPFAVSDGCTPLVTTLIGVGILANFALCVYVTNRKFKD